MDLNSCQQTFMVFYAIFWGATFNVLTKYKAFQFPLMWEFPRVMNRVLLSFLFLNILPIIYFGFIIWITSFLSYEITILTIILTGVIPAFGIFGFYRLYLGIIELSKSTFYYLQADKHLSEYKCLEPIIGNNKDEARNPNHISLGDKESGIQNIIWALIYINFGILIPIIYSLTVILKNFHSCCHL